MERIKAIYFESYLFYIISKIKNDLFPTVKETFMQSFFMAFLMWIDKNIIKSALMKLLFDPEHISSIWYKSFFYRKTTLNIRKISYYLPKASYSFENIYIGIFMAIILFVPSRIWNDLFWISLFGAMTLFYLSRNIRNRTGTVFALVNVGLILFLILIEVALPYSEIVSIIYLIAGIDLFFLISFSVKTRDDLKEVLFSIFIASSLLCGIGFMQNTLFEEAARATFIDGISFGEILVLIFPFVFIYPLEYLEGPRKPLYAAFIFISFFNVIMATQSKAALIGFIVEIAIFILADLKFFPFLILLMPLGLNSLIDNIKNTWYAATSYGNIFNNIIRLFTDLWKYGFGVNSQKFMKIYNTAGLRSLEETSAINMHYIKISPLYINFLIDIGTVFMVVFMWYILRLAHSSFTMLFTGDKRYKRFFTAGLATLVAISVSAFFETTIFASRAMLIYWAMLGIIRAVRIMNLGVYEP